MKKKRSKLEVTKPALEEILIVNAEEHANLYDKLPESERLVISREEYYTLRKQIQIKSSINKL